MNQKKVIAAASAVCMAFSCLVQTASADSYIVESFDDAEELECLVYQPYDDAGSLVISLNEDMRVFLTVKQLSEEKEYFLFYDAELNTGKTTYTMPLEAGEYEITIGVPYAKNSSKVIEHTEIITIENPDFNLDLQSTKYHYTLWRTEEALDQPVILQESSENEDGFISVYQAIEFQQVYPMTGDTDENGEVGISDATAALTIYAKQAAGLPIDEYTETQLSSADINVSGTIEISDATAILTYYARKAAGLEASWS